YLVVFETKHGYAPSFEEIGKGMKLTSLATVHKHISTLEKKGFIRRGYNQSRSIEIVQLPKPVKEQIIERRTQELPLVGRIAAGQLGDGSDYRFRKRREDPGPGHRSVEKVLNRILIRRGRVPV